MKKLIQLWKVVLFYSLLGLGIGLLFNTPSGIKIFIKSIFPVIYNQYWFFTSYVLLLLISPILNILDNVLSRQQMRDLLLLLFLLNIVIPTFMHSTLGGNSSSLTLFILLYLLGAQIRISKTKLLNSFRFSVLLTISSMVMYLVSVALFVLLGLELDKVFLISHAGYFANSSSVLIFFSSIGLFLIAKNTSQFVSKSINKLATYSFAIYLIHDNSFVREELWVKMFHAQMWLRESTFLLTLRIIIASSFVFICCILIEYVRRLFFKLFSNLFFNKRTQLNEILCIKWSAFYYRFNILTKKIFDRIL